MTKKEIEDRYFVAYLRHYQLGWPEADNELNDAARTAIREYAQIVPDAMCLKINGEKRLFKPTRDNPLHNFCCDRVFDAGAGNFPAIQKALCEWLNTRKLDALDKLDEELDKADQMVLVWS